MDFVTEIDRSSEVVDEREAELFNALAQAIYAKLPLQQLPEHVLSNTTEYLLEDGIEVRITLIQPHELDTPDEDLIELEIDEVMQFADGLDSVINRNRFLVLRPSDFLASYSEWSERMIPSLADVEEVSSSGPDERLYVGQAIEILMLLERIPDYFRFAD